MRPTLVLPSGLRCQLQLLCFSWHALTSLPFLCQGEGTEERKKNHKGWPLSKTPKTDPKGKGPTLTAEHLG